MVGVESGDSLDAVAELRAPSVQPLTVEAALRSPLLLLLDGVQDPGNLGTLLRSAAALRASGAVLLPGCCDAFNAKAVRAARGACFRLPLWRATWPQLQQLAQDSGAAVLGADPRGDPQGAQRAARDAAKPGAKPVWLALGAEGPGLTQAARELCTPVAVPGAGGMESLNVAAAGSILLYILSPQAEST
jgi:TrmH family RNA methyltransferase